MTKYKNRVDLKPGERIDDLERNGYGIIQNDGAFCFGMDAVLLSGFAKVKKGETAVDLGTGTGIIPILLEAKTKGKHFYGIELQEDIAEMAARSVMLNGLQEKIEILTGDIRVLAGTGDTEDGIKTDEEMLRGFYKNYSGRIDVVTSNPPYMKVSHGLKNPDDKKAIARHEVKCSLTDVCRAASRLLKSGGRFYMVHRPLRLPEIISEMKAVKLEPKRIKPVYPFIDKEANMILIEAVKAGGPECRFEKPVIVYKSEGVYTDEIYGIYGY
ncbi:MAG: tRNA1(Val) (adenine(37)-N6)-methyltransferase [Eubacteriales bacterium]|nr:tRNA1(Val) (adenine(37)-N6)-methyltransferase [Eubacteriales bacterium]